MATAEAAALEAEATDEALAVAAALELTTAEDADEVSLLPLLLAPPLKVYVMSSAQTV